MLHHQINSCNNSPACHSLCAVGNKSRHHSTAYFTPCWIHFRCLTRDEYTGCTRTYLALRPDIWLAAQLNADPANCCIISHFQYPRIQSQVDDNTSKTISHFFPPNRAAAREQTTPNLPSPTPCPSGIESTLYLPNWCNTFAAIIHSLRTFGLPHTDNRMRRNDPFQSYFHLLQLRCPDGQHTKLLLVDWCGGMLNHSTIAPM